MVLIRSTYCSYKHFKFVELEFDVLDKKYCDVISFFAVFFSFPTVLKLSQPTFFGVILPMNSQDNVDKYPYPTMYLFK